MKKLEYKVKNIDRTIIAKVTRLPVNSKKERQNYFVINDHIIPSHDYAGQISSQEYFDDDQITDPLVYNVTEVDAFIDGDVIAINKDGTIDFLFEKKVDFNPILVTNRCNANCIACPQPQVSKEEDRTPLNIRLISLIDKHAKTIGVTGGEPTLLGDNFLLIMKELKEQLPSVNILLLTNGIKFESYDFANKLRSINNTKMQVDIPIYSDIDSDHDNALGVRGFYKMIQGLHNLTSLGFRIGLRVVIQKINYHRLKNISEFIYHNFPFVNHIAFMQMEIYGHAIDNLEDIWVDPYDYASELKEAVIYLSARRMNVSIYNSPLCLLPKELWEYSQNSISSWKRTYNSECDICLVKEQCGGLFSTSGGVQSKHIRPILSHEGFN